MKKRILSLLLAFLMVGSFVYMPICTVGAETVTDSEPVVGKVVKITSEYPWLWTDPQNTNTQVQATASKLPELLQIVDVYQFSTSTTLYQLDAAEGYTWPDGYPSADFTGKYWIESNKVSFPCDKCGEFGCTLEHKDWCEICRKDDCGMNHITGTVTDRKGNPVLDADGKKLTITVSGDLPEGAVVSASILEIDGEKLPNIFDIKVLSPGPDGQMIEWQPIDEGKTVTISIPVDFEIPANIKDSVYMNVYHIIDYVDAIDNNVEILDISVADDELKGLLADAIVAYGDNISVPYEIFEDTEVIDGRVSIDVDSFSVYVLENGVFRLAENEDGVVSIPINDGASGSIYTYYASAGTNFIFYPTSLSIGGNFTLDGMYSEGVSVSKDEYLIYQVGHLTIDKVNVGDVIKVKVEIPHIFSADEVFYVHVKIVREATVAYNANGKTAAGMPDPLSKVIATDGTIQYTIPEGKPTAANCTFKGWALNNAGTGTLYQPGDKFTLVGDLTFYAIWEEDKFDVSFNHNYKIGNNDPVVDVMEDVQHNTVVEFPEPPYRENYTFLGWCASQNGQSDWYDAGETITVTSAATYFAIWGADLTITISGSIDEIKMMEGTEQTWKDVPQGYFSQAGQSANREDVEGFLKGTTFRIKAAAGSSFNAGIGKAYTSSGATVIFWTEDNDKTLFVQLPDGVTVDTTITITTEEDKFTVSYVPNGGTAVAPDLNISSGSHINPNDKTTTREGYTLDGWYSDAALTQKVTGAVAITAHTTFYAKWDADDFTIAYNLDGGVLATGVTNPEKYNAETEDFTLNNPTKKGYTFDGWIGTGLTEATKEVTVAQGSTGNRRYTAIWTPITYTVTYILTDSNGITGTNNEGNPATYTVESGEIVLKDPIAPAGYKFVKWKEGKTIANGTIGDKTFTAVWELALADLTVQVSGDRGVDQSYVFVVTDSKGEIVAKVVIPVGKNAVTIKALPVGVYTVAPVNGWAWRLQTDDNGQVELNSSKTVEFSWTFIDNLIYWLNGYGYDKKGG